MLLYAQSGLANFPVTWLFYFQIITRDDSGLLLVCGFIIAVIVVISITSNNSARQRAKALEDARVAYQTSLAQLKRNPTSADSRQRTLEFGRIYSNLTRNKKGVTIFDEIALMNDINAACAGATTVSSPPRTTTAPLRQTIEERLARLAELKAKGLIDDAEYNARRHKILDEV